jgi:hypothetical protein
MRDTPRLWWHMRTYNPPEGRPNSNGPHRIGDAAIVAAISSFAAGVVAFVRRK